MLVLSRKKDERLIIDGNIVVTIVKVGGGTVRLGIEAPAEVSVRREELAPLTDNADGNHILIRRAG